jgi:hypothetical protein
MRRGPEPASRRVLLIALSVIMFGASTMNSSAYLSNEAPLCKNWERECARLWGGTRHYRQCMRQPQAIRDCQADNYGGSDDLCTNWLRECTRLPDDQMKWLGRIRHYDLVKFVRKHQLDWNWVLLGASERAPQRPALRVIQEGRQ